MEAYTYSIKIFIRDILNDQGKETIMHGFGTGYYFLQKFTYTYGTDHL